MIKVYNNLEIIVKFYFYINKTLHFIRLNLYIWLMPIFVSIYTISLFTDFIPRVKDYIFIFFLIIIFIESYSVYKLEGKKYFIYFFISILILLPSALYNQELEYYLLYIFRKSQYFIMAFIPILFISKINIHRYWKVYSLVLVFFICFSMLYVKPDFLLSYKGLFLSRTSAGVLALFSILVLYNEIKNKIYFLFLCIPIIFFIVISGSKTALYSFALLILIHLLKKLSFNETLNTRILYFGLISLVIYYLFFELIFFSDINKLFYNNVITSSNQRIVDMFLGMTIWFENIFIGVGLNNFIVILNDRFESYAYMLFPNVPWNLLLGYDNTSQNAVIDLLAIYGLYSIVHIAFLGYLLFIAIKFTKNLYFKVILFVPIVILLVNSFSLGNGFEFLYYLFISYVISQKFQKERL